MFTGTYHHTQPGTLMRIALGAGFVGCLVFVSRLQDVAPRAAATPAFVGAVLLVCLALFHALTVTVTRDVVMVTFGVGLVRKRIPVRDIVGASAVRSPVSYTLNTSGTDLRS